MFRRPLERRNPIICIIQVNLCTYIATNRKKNLENLIRTSALPSFIPIADSQLCSLPPLNVQLNVLQLVLCSLLQTVDNRNWFSEWRLGKSSVSHQKYGVLEPRKRGSRGFVILERIKFSLQDGAGDGKDPLISNMYAGCSIQFLHH